MGAWLLSYGAGWLITLSPCVLPILPLMLSGAASQDRFAPLLMALGLTGSFALFGSVIAAFGGQLGLSPEVLRISGAVLLLLAAIILLLPRLARGLSGFLAPLATRADALGRRLSGWGRSGMVLTGALLGAVWAPCSGPALVAAVGLAAEAGAVGEGFVRLLFFGLGASSPLLLIAYGARGLFVGANRNRATRLRPVLALALGVISLLILTGADLYLQQWILDRLPLALVAFSVSL